MTPITTPASETLGAGREEAIAFNLCSLHGFDPEFVMDHREFAMAVITEYERSHPAPALSVDLEELKRLAEAATPGPWDRMPGRGLVRAIRDDLAVPLFEPLEPYSDPLLEASTCRVGREVVFRANSQAARESAAIRQAVHNSAFIAAANPQTILSLIAHIERGGGR